MRKNIVIAMALMLLAVILSGCSTDVPGGTIGRIKTSDGWNPNILKPGRYNCYGHDQLYLLEITQKSFKEKMNILVGGKVNLTVEFTVRVRPKTEDEKLMAKAFETVTAKYFDAGKGYDAAFWITIDSLYITFLQMKAQAIPRAIYEVQPDVQTVLANSPALAAQVKKEIMETAQSTPLVVEDAQITNYDWPLSITKAQEELASIQLKEAAAAAQVRAELQQARGQLAVEEARKLVELKKAEAVAESIDIIKKKLAGAPEYLMWHQIRVMGEAANGPNNAFILYPYNTDVGQVRSMMNNAQLKQMLDSPKPETSKK